MAGVVAAMKGFRTDEGKELGDVIIGKIKEAVRTRPVLSGQAAIRAADGRALPPAVRPTCAAVRASAATASDPGRGCRSPSSTPASAASRSCTSASCRFPHEDFVYLGDTARFPYGDRSPRQLLALALELAAACSSGAKLLVVACNSATAAALPALREELEGRVPVVGVVTPESRLAGAATRNGRVGLLATPATVASGAYARALAEAAPEAELHAVASPELAPLIQEGGEVDERVVDCVEGACRRSAGPGGHGDPRLHALPAGAPVLQRALGRGVTIVSSGEAIAEEVERGSRGRPRERRPAPRAPTASSATGDPEEFRRLGTRFLQLPIGEVEQVDVEAGSRGGRAA